MRFSIRISAKTPWIKQVGLVGLVGLVGQVGQVRQKTGGTPKSTRLVRRSLGEGGSPAQLGEAAQTLPTATFGTGGTPKSTRSPAQPGEAAQTLPTATFWGTSPPSIIQRKMAFLFTRAEIL